MDVRVGLWRKLSAEKLMLLNCGVGEDSRESLGLQGDPTSPSWRRSVLGVHWKDWCWSWNSQYFGHLMWRIDSLEKTLMLGGTGGRRRRGWQRMRWLDASQTRWTWVWVNSWSWWWTGRPGMLRFMASQRVGHDWATELNWLDTNSFSFLINNFTDHHHQTRTQCDEDTLSLWPNKTKTASLHNGNWINIKYECCQSHK